MAELLTGLFEMNSEEIRAWLDAAWRDILNEENATPDREVDAIVNSEVVSIRYALITQLLGKLADGSRSLMSLQSGSADKGAWNARSFASSIVAPWVADNHNVLGTSADPYVSKPLRRPRLERGMPNVRDKEDWRRLYDFLSPLEQTDPATIEIALRQCLRSVARRLTRQRFNYQIPRRIGMSDLSRILGLFLETSSRGLRPLAVATALMRTLAGAFSLFAEVKSQGLTEADSATGMPGDIMCYNQKGHLILAIEVKDQNLTMADLRTSITKTREAGGQLSNLLFAVPGVREADRRDVDTAIHDAWAAGLNIHQIKILTLSEMAFSLLDEQYRIAFLKEMGEELDRRGELSHRLSWRDLLSDL